MKIQAPLYDSCFRRELTSAIEQDLQSRYPCLSSDWLAYSLHLNSYIAQVIGIFIQEVDRGHIFYDDLFGTTVKKYVANGIPFYCNLLAELKEVFFDYFFNKKVAQFVDF